MNGNVILRKWFLAAFWLIILSACSSKSSFNNETTESDANDTSLFSYASGKGDKDTVRLKIPNYPLRNPKDLDILIQQIGNARVVLLGEATHGTAEFYNWRAEITKRLIQEKGFDFIASESEWADSYRVNNFIKGAKKDSASVVELLRQYDRWPTWMWGNYEVASLVTWLNHYNQDKGNKDKIGFFGLDVYCLWESMTEVMPYLKGQEPSVLKAAQKVHECFQPYNADAQEYTIAVANAEEDCRTETSRFWKSIQKITEGKTNQNESHFVMEQNALVALNGERYYRAMVGGGPLSWNIRDEHMAQTLKRLLAFHGPDSKAIIWEHNTHVGDARYTNMVREGLVNVGQLVRKEYGENNVFIVGFTTYEGTVIAAEEWGKPYKRMEVPKAEQGSWEEILHKLNPTDKIVLSKDIVENKPLKKEIGQRAIGVVYSPDELQFGYFVPTIIPKRYDAYVFINKSSALHPIHIKQRNEPPDLYPSGK